MGLITKNAGCLNTKLAVKEQLLNFVCQHNVRDAMAHENEPCIAALAESPKVNKQIIVWIKLLHPQGLGKRMRGRHEKVVGRQQRKHLCGTGSNFV